MAVILNFNLPKIANSINQIICLYDPSPVFQFEQNADFTYSILSGDKYKRDSNVASAGFPASVDPGPLVNGKLPPPSLTTFPLPANSYTKNIPSQVYGTPVASDNYSVVMIVAALARIEPGFSRLRIDYTVFNESNNTFSPEIFYADCPFYEGWDVTARELNNVVGYIEGGTAFLQSEINILEQEVAYALSREFWRGTSVSGQLANSGQITVGLQVGTNALMAKNLPSSEYSLLAPQWEKQTKQPLPLPSMMLQLDEKAFPSGGAYGPIRDIDVNTIIGNINAPGKTANGRWILKNCDGPSSDGAGPQPGNTPHTSALLTENDDGTLTFFLYSDHYENTGLQCTGISQAIVTVSGAGGVTADANGSQNSQRTVGAAISMFGFNGYSSSGPQLTDQYGNNSNPQAYYHNSTQLYKNSTNSSGQIVTPYFPAIVTGVFDEITTTLSSGAGKKVYRAVLKPTLAAGGVLSFGVSNHITHNGSVGSYTDSGALYSQPSPDGRTLTLHGGATAIATITSVHNVNQEGDFGANLCVNGGGVTVYGTNFSNNFNLYIGGIGFPQPAPLFVSSTTMVFSVAPGTPLGNQTMVLISKTNLQQQSNSIQVNITSTPTINAVTPSTATVGQQVTITGSGFGPYFQNNLPSTYSGGTTPYGSSCYVNFGDTNGPIAQQTVTNNVVSWTDTQIVVQIPTFSSSPPAGYSAAPTSFPHNVKLYVRNQCGSAGAGFVLGSNVPKTFSIVPTPAHIASSTSKQFQAIIFDPSNNANTDVSGSTVWSILGGAFPGTDQGSGNSAYGSITQQGVYNAPTQIPLGQDGPNGVSVVRLVGRFTDASGAYSNYATVFVDLTASLSIAPNTGTITIPTQQQFTATFTLNGNNVDESFYATWSINNIVGGNNSVGTIANGLYVPPVQAPPTNPLNISASYVYNGTRYVAGAQIFVSSPPVTQTVLTVTSQINVYLGDGRFGYIPTGSTITCHLNDYVFVILAERLNAGYKFPDPTYQPVQQLQLIVKNVHDSDIEQTIYNTGSRQQQPDGTTLTGRTVVLGIVDPSDGFFHSMWDIGQAPVLASSQAHGMTINVENANALKAFPDDHHFKGSIMQYVDDLSSGAQSQLDALYNRANVVLAGSATYDASKRTLFITKPLRVLGVGNETYGILGIVPTQQIEVQENQYVYIDKDYRLCVGSFTDYFTSSKTEIIVVGTVLDKFYTTWPLIDGLETDTSGVKSDGETSYMRVGPLLVQWGTTDEYELAKKDSVVTDKILLPMAYSTSCVVMTEPAESNGAYPAVQTNEQSLTDFDIKIVNQQGVKIKTKVSWLAIGV